MPPSLEDLFQRLRSRATERPTSSSSASATPPSSSPARTTTTTSSRTRRARSSGRRSGSTRSSREEHAPPDRRTGSSRGRRDAAGDAGPRAVDGRRRVGAAVLDGRRRGRESTRPGAAGDRTYTYRVPDRAAPTRAGRGGPRRVRPAAGARDRPRRAAHAAAGSIDQADRRSRSGPTGRSCRPLDRCARAGSPTDLPRAAGARAPGDAAAGPARAARARRRAPPGTRPRRRRRTADRRRAATGRPRTLTSSASSSAARGRPRSRRARRPGRPAPAPARPGGRRPDQPRMDAARRRGRAALRALDPLTATGAPRAGTLGERPPAGLAGRSVRASVAALAELGGRRRRADSPAPDLAGPPRRRRPWRASSARGLVDVDVRERPGGRSRLGPAGRRGGAPASERPLCRPQAEAVARDRARRSRPRDPRPLLLDGVTGGGKTAIYVEAIAACLEARPAGPRPRPGDRPRPAARRPAPGRPRRAGRARPLGPGRRRAGRRVAADPGRRRRTSSSGRGWRSLAPLADVGLIIVDEEHDAGVQERPDAAAPGARHGDRLAGLAGAAVVLGSATPAVETEGRARDGRYRPRRPAGPAGRRRADGRDRRPARRARGRRSAGCCRGRWRRRSPASTRAPASRRSSSSTGAGPRRSSCAATAATSRPARTASDRSSTTRPGTTLRCHHCGRATPLASRCPTCGSPRIRYLGGGTERVEREVRDAFPGLRVGRLDRDVVEHRGAADAGHRRLRRRPPRRPRRDEPRHQGPRHPGGDAGRRRVVGRRAQPARRARRRADLPAPRPGDRPGGPRRPTGPRDHPDLPAGPPGDHGPSRERRPAAFYDAELALRERFGSPPFGRLVKLTVGLADRGAAEREAERDGRAAADAGHGTRCRGRPWSARRRPTSPGAPTAGAGTSSCAGHDPAPLLDGGVDAPWSVDVDPESLL